MKQEKDMRVSDIHADPVSPIGANEVPSWNPQGPTDHTCPMPPTPSSDALPGFTPQYTHQFRFWCQHILPLVYEQSLSYYEVLCKIASKLNEVIQSENALNENMVAAVNKINELIEKFNTFITEVKAFLDCFEARMDAVEQRMDAVETELQAFETRINAEMQSFEARIQAIVDQYTALVQQLQTQVQNLTTLVNSFDGRITTNTSNITTNTSNIATNTSNIATNTSNIATLRSDLTALTARVQANETWIRNFKHEKYGYYDVTQGDDPFVGDGTSDDTARLASIIEGHKAIYFPKKGSAYKIYGAFSFSLSNLSILSNESLSFVYIPSPSILEINNCTIVSTGRIVAEGTGKEIKIKDSSVSCMQIIRGNIENSYLRCDIKDSNVNTAIVTNSILQSATTSGNVVILNSGIGKITVLHGDTSFYGVYSTDNFLLSGSGNVFFINSELSKGVASPTARISADGAESVTFQNCKLAGKIVLNNIVKQAVMENCNADGMELDSSMSRITLNGCLVENSELDFESCKASILNSRVNPTDPDGSMCKFNDCDSVSIQDSVIGDIQVIGTQGESDTVTIFNSEIVGNHPVSGLRSAWFAKCRESTLRLPLTDIAGDFKDCNLTLRGSARFGAAEIMDCRITIDDDINLISMGLEGVMKHCYCDKVGTVEMTNPAVPDLIHNATSVYLIVDSTTPTVKKLVWAKSSGATRGVQNFYDENFGTSTRQIWPSGAGTEPQVIPINARFSVLRDTSTSYPYYEILYSDDPNSLSKDRLFTIANWIKMTPKGDRTLHGFQTCCVYGSLLFLNVNVHVPTALHENDPILDLDIPDTSELYKKEIKELIMISYGENPTGGWFDACLKPANSKTIVSAGDVLVGHYVFSSFAGFIQDAYPVPSIANSVSFYREQPEKAPSAYLELLQRQANPTNLQIAEALGFDTTPYRPVKPHKPEIVEPITPD